MVGEGGSSRSAVTEAHRADRAFTYIEAADLFAAREDTRPPTRYAHLVGLKRIGGCFLGPKDIARLDQGPIEHGSLRVFGSIAQRSHGESCLSISSYEPFNSL